MLKDLLRFNDLLLRFQKVERVVRVVGKERRENNVEHSYHLAMLAWYLIEKDALPLHKDKALAYALVHDLVEVYAGDTFFYSSEEEKAKKHKREREAAERLRKEFPDCAELHAHIAQYEKRADAEALFVHALDKIVPVLNMYADGGRLWRKEGITLSMLVEKKRDIVKQSPELEPYFEELVVLLREQPELFPAEEAQKTS